MPETANPDMVMVRSPKQANGGLVNRLRGLLPEGRGLPQEEWRIRHRAVRIFILAHAVGLALFGLARDELATGLVIGECLLLASIGLLAGVRAFSRKLRGALAALGCVLASAILVQFWGGVIEAHFHFFVVVALISLYQDWVPFGLAIVFVALDHGVTGVLLPDWVYNHAAARSEPWRWAVIHAVFVLSECVALIAVWRANEQARAETDRVLRSTAEGLIGVDGEGKVTFANPAAIFMMGRTETDLLGRTLHASLLGEDGRPVFAAPHDVSDSGPVSFQAILRRGDDKVLPVEVLWTPVRGRQGAVVALRDLTDRVRIEQEREVATHQRQELEHLREVDSFKTRFMNMAAHELNTPLTPIKMQMHLLKSKADQPELEMHKRSIHLLDRNFQRLTSLVGDLLDSSRLQSDRMPVRPVAMDLATAVTEVTESFRPAAKEAGVRLDSDIQGDLTCDADADRITQAITNLLSNALKFTPSGGAVSVQAEALNGHIRVKVQDSGVGLTQQQAARLFKPFEQVHEAQVRNKGGSGLGLYITRGIIELHGGRIWVESPGPGLGSAFLFEIPRKPPVRAAVVEDDVPQGVPEAPPGGAAA